MGRIRFRKTKQSTNSALRINVTYYANLRFLQQQLPYIQAIIMPQDCRPAKIQQSCLMNMCWIPHLSKNFLNPYILLPSAIFCDAWPQKVTFWVDSPCSFHDIHGVCHGEKCHGKNVCCEPTHGKCSATESGTTLGKSILGGKKRYMIKYQRLTLAEATIKQECIYAELKKKVQWKAFKSTLLSLKWWA